MPRLLAMLAFLMVAAPAFAAGTETPDNRAKLSYGNALYYAFQDEWFEAISRLDAQSIRFRGVDQARYEALSNQIGPVAGWFELNYRMHQRAGRAMKAVIDGAVQDTVRNEALFRLARMYFQKDQPEDAQRAVERIHGDVSPEIRTDLMFLRANIGLALGRAADAAGILKRLQDEKNLEGFSSYNLAIALLRTGDEKQGREYLDRTGRIESDDRVVLAIRDKANLILGEKLLADEQFDAAKEVLDRVRLDGPFSNRALLSSGWTDAMQRWFKNALVPWSILAGREIADPAVQEVMLAVPYAYSRLGVYGTAALKYEAALDAFGKETDRLDASIASIRRGAFLKSLLREELKQDATWLARLRELPDTPETAYLLDLMASNDFQESLRNYLDLDDLRKRLETWLEDLAAFENIIASRRTHYQPILPAVDRDFKQLDARMQPLAERRDRLARQIEALQAAPHPELLATPLERAMSEMIARLEKLATPRNEEGASTLVKRIRRLRGILTWNIYADYDKRFEAARGHLRDMDRELDALKRQRRSFTITRQTAVESYEGYADVIPRLRSEIEAAREKVKPLIARQGELLEIMAVNELARRRDRLEELRGKARFALADSYDRATKARLQKKDTQ